MADNHPRIIKNSKRQKCAFCKGVHVFITSRSPDAHCGTPRAFSYEEAVRIANLLANGPRDVLRIPDDTVVIMDDSARRLPREGSGTLHLAQFTTVERSI